MSTLQRKTRRGLSAIEVVVVVAIMGIFVLCVFMILPRPARPRGWSRASGT